MPEAKATQSNNTLRAKLRKRIRRRRHDPWLVLNVSIFNSKTRWDRILDPFTTRQNAW